MYVFKISRVGQNEYFSKPGQILPERACEKNSISSFGHSMELEEFSI